MACTGRADGEVVPLAFQIDAPFTFGQQIEARARHSEIADRTLLVQDDRSWTYREYRDECVRLAHFLIGRIEARGSSEPGHVAILLENHLELLSLLGGCGYAGLTLFGLNSGLRGPTLSGVLNQARPQLLVVDEKFLPNVEAVRDQLETLAEQDILVLPTGGSGGVPLERTLEAQVSASVGPPGIPRDAPVREVTPETNLMVIYTSGTTGLPKGINNSHFKLLAIGRAVSERLELGPEDRGYACMPLFHSNALFLGFQPAFAVGASMAIRVRFSARSFVTDIKRYGVSYWNYVGEPVHYILGAIEQEYGVNEEKILAEVAGDPDNRLRYAIGNGASPPDIDRFIHWLGMEDMFELYGSTEAAISTFRRKTDPRGSVGEITDDAVKILDPAGQECALAQVAEDGKLMNYAEAVGEICRVSEEASLFQGYFDNAEANEARYRAGVYHSGDLGHVRDFDGRRFLYFDGRTDDWIRKDGENFSAAQVARLVGEHPDVVLAAAYGVPCAVSDELVMVALKLRPGVQFSPKAFFGFCESQVASGGMDPKWFPDFVRIVDDFLYTQTQKILVRGLKAEHFDRRRLVEDSLFRRLRGSNTYAPFQLDDFEGLRVEFARSERANLLDR